MMVLFAMSSPQGGASVAYTWHRRKAAGFDTGVAGSARCGGDCRFWTPTSIGVDSECSSADLFSWC